MTKGIIFDFDGTLANTLPVIFACYDYSTEKILGRKADRAPFIETFGQPLYVCLTSIFGVEAGSRICDEYRAYQDLHHDEHVEEVAREDHAHNAARQHQKQGVILRDIVVMAHVLDRVDAGDKDHRGDQQPEEQAQRVHHLLVRLHCHSFH